MTQLTARSAPAHPDRPPVTLLPTGRVGPPRWTDEPGARFVLAEVALVAATLLTGVLTRADLVRLAVLAVVVLASTTVVPTRAGVGLAVTAWALWTGFVEHRSGQLTLAPADLGRLALLLGVAAAGLVLARAHRGARRATGGRGGGRG